MKEITQLDQSTWLKGKRCFTLQDDGVLRVSHTEAGRHQEFSVEVVQLNPEPIRDKRKATSMIVGMAVFGLLAGGLIFASLGPGHSHGAELPGLAVAAFFLLPFLLCLYQYLKQSYDVLVFQSPYTGGRIAFLNNVPSEETFAGFINRLRSEIRTHRDKLPSLPKSLSQELEALAKLRENGALSEAEFTTAKQNLINSAKAAGGIGFGNR
ncbi:MAG: hypothetical protein ABSA97_06780 [Verrucomicrobiia bacterium]